MSFLRFLTRVDTRAKLFHFDFAAKETWYGFVTRDMQRWYDFDDSRDVWSDSDDSRDVRGCVILFL